MHQGDAIPLAAFDDEPLPSPPAAPAPRPATRPRPGPSEHPLTGPTRLVILDAGPVPQPNGSQPAARPGPMLPFDIGFFEQKTASFLVVYSAGTPLDALKPRTVLVPAEEPGPPITSLTLCTRMAAEPQLVPYRTLECSRDLRGQCFTVRFVNPADPQSLVIEDDAGGDSRPAEPTRPAPP